MLNRDFQDLMLQLQCVSPILKSVDSMALRKVVRFRLDPFEYVDYLDLSILKWTAVMGVTGGWWRRDHVGIRHMHHQEIFANDCDICCKEPTMQLWLHFSSLSDFPEFHLVLEAPNAEVCTIRPWEDSKASSLMAPMDISMEVPPVLWMVASWDGSENGEFATESRDIIGLTTRDRTIISQLYPYYLDLFGYIPICTWE